MLLIVKDLYIQILTVPLKEICKDQKGKHTLIPFLPLSVFAPFYILFPSESKLKRGEIERNIKDCHGDEGAVFCQQYHYINCIFIKSAL